MFTDFTIKRSAKRRTVGISIYPDLRVVVSAPFRYSEERLQAFVREKSSWIEEKLKEFAKYGPAQPKRTYLSGDRISILGKTYVLKVFEGPLNQAHLTENEILIEATSAKRTKEAFARLLHAQAAQHLKGRIIHFANQLRVQPKSLTIKDYKSRWGTCKSTGDIVLNWRILLSSEAIVDYVVVHELSHLIEFNHSRAFWRVVGSVFPDYKRARKILRESSRRGDLDL